MILLTHVAGPKHAPTLVLIPGGPGLSSWTLRSLDLLSRSFSLAYVDFPGTNGVPYERDRSFEELMTELHAELSKLPGELVILGHSFGGFFAARAALECSSAKGLVCVSVPFTRKCMESAVERFEAGKTPELVKAEAEWNQAPSDQTFARWLSEYGPFYFGRERQAQGRELMLRDPCSHRFFLQNQGDGARMEPVLDLVADWGGKKIFLAETTGFIATGALRGDATRGRFEFHAVEGASHFVMLDQPERVARLIESSFATRTGES